MYAEPNQQHYNSPRMTWELSNSKQRNAMLLDAGYATHRTLTLRSYDQLPPEVKIDLITAHNNPACKTDKGVLARQSLRPAGRSLKDSLRLARVGGFTLLELLVVLLILGSLAGVAQQALEDAPQTAEQYKPLFYPSLVGVSPLGQGALPASPQRQGEQLFPGQQK